MVGLIKSDIQEIRNDVSNEDLVLDKLLEKEFTLKVNIQDMRILSTLLKKDIFQIENKLSNYSPNVNVKTLEEEKKLLERVEKNILYINRFYEHMYKKKCCALGGK